MGWPCPGSLSLACGPRARVREEKTSQTDRLGVHTAGVQPARQANVGLTRPTERRSCFVVWVPTLTLPWRGWSRFHVTHLLSSPTLLGFPLSFAKGSVGHVAPAPGGHQVPPAPLGQGGQARQGLSPCPTTSATGASRGRADATGQTSLQRYGL